MSTKKKILFYSLKSHRKVVHFSGCSYLRGEGQEKYGFFYSSSAAAKEGYHLCKRCNPLEKMYRENEVELKKFCFENVIAVEYRGYEIDFTTLESKWKVVPVSRSKVLFFHANEMLNKKAPKTPIHGYHLQNIEFDNLLSFCQYILEHDTYRENHPVRTRKLPPPKKGTKRWRGQEKKKKKKEKKKAVKNVLRILNGMRKEEE